MDTQMTSIVRSAVVIDGERRCPVSFALPTSVRLDGSYQEWQSAGRTFAAHLITPAQGAVSR